MPKIKMPKSTPSLDMTPMVDLGFLLVTFFMLAANFRDSDPVQVSPPSSFDAQKEVPQKSTVIVTIDKGGRAYFNCTPPEGNTTMKGEILAAMCSAYNIKLTTEQADKFNGLSSFGCPMRDLPKYLDMNAQERQVYSAEGLGIPADSLNGRVNELKSWISYANTFSLRAGGEVYKEVKSYDETAEPNDYKPKFILKVEGAAEYAHAKKVIDIFRDLNLNNLNFITSSEGSGSN